MLVRLAIFAVACALAGCGAARDPLAELDIGERGRVVRVLDGDALVLDTGQSVRLVSIEAPAGPYRDRKGEDGFEEGKRLLEDMALGREVELRYAGLTRDRYDRALAHVVTTDALGPPLWLNGEMVRRGGARVRIYPDTSRGSETLLDLEAEARAASAGLWGKGTWAILPARDLPSDSGRFQIVEAVTRQMAGSEAPGAACDITLEESDLTLKVMRAAAAICQTPPGSPVRVRGYLRDRQLEIAHPLNVEPLPAP